MLVRWVSDSVTRWPHWRGLTSDPVNGAVVQLWQCIDNHPPQEWIVENGQVKLAGTNFCLDFPLGTATGIGDLHIWECTCNKNQAFRVRCGLYPGQDPNCTDK